MIYKDIYSIASRYADFLVYHLGLEDAYLYSEVLHSTIINKRDSISESINQVHRDFEILRNLDCPNSTNGSTNG